MPDASGLLAKPCLEPCAAFIISESLQTISAHAAARFLAQKYYNNVSNLQIIIHYCNSVFFYPDFLKLSIFCYISKIKTKPSMARLLLYLNADFALLFTYLQEDTDKNVLCHYNARQKQQHRRPEHCA